ncbi:protein NLP6-like [Chenopodium quinoa]|uniref:protein NLP6-like n=1 Tax=Chenopodium quinoa TaxID=63459 RepID=UPI000B785719|nr:protein NLP6-like [Chenopodium quinoa]XP_021717710.1 protein NLP6-like [Chenopodium quinoa]
MLLTQELMLEPVPDGIFTSYPSSDPQFPSWMMVDSFSNNDSSVENDEALGTFGRVDEPTPTVSLPEELVLPFSPVSNFIDQVNDDGSGNVKLLAEQNLEKTLLDFKPKLKTNQIVAAQLWFPTKIVKTNVLRSSQHNIPGSWTEDKRFMRDVTEGYLCESLTRVYSSDKNSKTGRSFNIIDTLIPYLSTMEDVTCLLNRQVSVTAYQLRCPQWAPNLHIYKSHHQNSPKPSITKENYIICGTLAIPVFDPYTNQCVGVYEVVVASTEVDLVIIDIICNLLKAVNLRADTQFHYQPRQRLLAEISKVMIKVCKDHDLPLAQTWMPCTCPDQNCNSQKLCMSNAELPFYMRDSSYFPFWRAGAMYHMAEGQAVAGTTFSSKGLCFCRDITRFPDNFALVPLSRQFKINCSLAICLGSAYANNDFYIVQFFWQRTLKNTIENDDLKVLSVTSSMKQQFDKLNMVSPTYEELEAETEQVRYRTKLIGGEGIRDDFTFLSNTVMTGEEQTEVSLVLPEEISSNMFIDHQDHKSINNPGIEVVQCKVIKKSRKKRCNNLSKEDLEPYLKGTLNDAANDLGISKSTLKRKCKELKIENWQDERKKKGIGVPARRKRAAKRNLLQEMELVEEDI